MNEPRKVRLEVATDVLDAIVKSLGQSRQANIQKRRRFENQPESQRAKEAAREYELIQEGLAAAQRAQDESF
jgi:hypothetical protein